MLRSIVGVVVGYVVMVLVVFATFSIAYLVMGVDGAFQPGAFDVTAAWVVVSIVLGLIAAFLGGHVCAAISRNTKAPLALVALVLVLGLILAFPTLTTSEDPGVREGDLGSMEAMEKAQQPKWLTLANPFIGALGVMLGARSKRPKPPDRSAK